MKQASREVMAVSDRASIVEQVAKAIARGQPALAAHPEFPEFMAAYQRRLGETPEQRLGWILDFVKKNLARLLPGERAALGHDLRLIALFSLNMGLGARGSLRTTMSPMSDETLERYQREIRDGLRGLLSADATPWQLPTAPALSRKARGSGFDYLFLGDESAGVLGGVANVVLEAGDRLRACRECGDPFVARENRQHYCTPACSQRTRNRRRTPRLAQRRKR